MLWQQSDGGRNENGNEKASAIMADPTTWETLPKSSVDEQTIAAAVAAAIAAHDADADAHMQALGSLAEHRDADIIDHKEESVYNDKLVPYARAFVAIVDPSNDVDFDTIAEAHAYAVTKGGGNILITPGDHYITGILELSAGVNFIGTDRDTCKVHAGQSAVNYLTYPITQPTYGEQTLWQNIGIVDHGYTFMREPSGDEPMDTKLVFDNCKFSGTGRYIKWAALYQLFRECDIRLYAGAAGFACGKIMDFDHNHIWTADASGAVQLLDAVGGFFENWVSMYNNYGDGDASLTIEWFNVALNNARIIGNAFGPTKGDIAGFSGCMVIGNTMTFMDNANVTIDDAYAVYVGNTIGHNSTKNIVFGASSEGNTFVGNLTSRPAKDSGTDNHIAANGGVKTYAVVAAATTALDFETNECVELTPNSTRTITTTVPRKGQRRTLLIKTSGATSYTLTFGTGFGPLSTLATGTTSSRLFLLEFISDGTKLYQIVRTGAQTI